MFAYLYGLHAIDWIALALVWGSVALFELIGRHYTRRGK